MSTRPVAKRRPLPTSPFNRTPPKEQVDYGDNDRVCHDRHGLGRVLRTESDSVVVDFGAGKVVRVARTSDRLTPL
ncbi:MAG TPA: hypothetical protein VFD41_13385 [Actinomycetales bacterium]|nr:hypothetical protein [Actinomycetales bacterium]